MKTYRISSYARVSLIMAISFFIITSCEKNDSDKEHVEYIGAWVTLKTVQSDEGEIEIQDVVNFNTSSFTEIASIQDPESEEWINIIGRKGKITEKSGEMNVSITEVGYTTVDEETGSPTGEILYFEEGTDEFLSMLEELEMSQNYKAKYTVSGDELTLKADNNNNGQFDDEDEVNIFTRKE